MSEIHEIGRQEGSHRDRKRIGRGPGSGTGKTAGKGHKGSKARAGHHGPGGGKPGYEGGQMPLHRRLPKRGFTNIFKREWAEVNLADLERLFDADTAVTPEALVERGLVRKSKQKSIVVLGNGDLKKPLTISAHRFSGKAKEKIEAAGGKAEVIAAAQAQEQ